MITNTVIKCLVMKIRVTKNLVVKKHNIKSKFTPIVSSLSMAFVLIACSSDKVEINTDYSALSKSAISEKPLVVSNRSAFDTYIKNGIRLRFVESNEPIALASASEGDNGNVSTSVSSFSTTNVHEIGVDEADRLKYNGEYLFTVAQAGYSVATIGNTQSYATTNSIGVLKTDLNSITATEVAIIENDSEDVSITDIFLRAPEKQLISVANTQFYTWNSILADNDWSWTSGKTEIQLYDITNPEVPSEQWKIEIEGNLEGSRRVDNHLYLVTRYVPDIAELNYGAITVEDKESNELLILNTPSSDLLPHYQTNDGEIRPLVSAEDCFVAEDTNTNDGYADLVTLTAIDLDSRSVSSSVCLNASVQGIYTSTNGFYIGGTSNTPWLEFSNLTSVHKFALNNGDLEYKASATLPGYLGWNEPSFRMSEFNGDLRIVTSDFQGVFTEPEHHLNILREDGSNQLQVVGSLPNTEHPEAIGKPGEDIFAVRFSGERAYIVTFERIDPLYVIDLENPADPVIAGSLEIPGFSRYLQELEDGWLLGIGYQIENSRQQGLKVELYDVRDITAPKVASTLTFGVTGTRSEALWDLRAISLLNIDENSKRLTLPIDIWEKNESEFNHWIESGLFGIDISKNDIGELSLSLNGKLITENANDDVNQPQNYPFNSGVGRSVLHGDAVFYLNGNHIYTSQWDNWSETQGPF